jgi:hypothetical protein
MKMLRKVGGMIVAHGIIGKVIFIAFGSVFLLLSEARLATLHWEARFAVCGLLVMSIGLLALACRRVAESVTIVEVLLPVAALATILFAIFEAASLFELAGGEGLRLLGGWAALAAGLAALGISGAIPMVGTSRTVPRGSHRSNRSHLSDGP